MNYELEDHHVQMSLTETNRDLNRFVDRNFVIY